MRIYPLFFRYITRMPFFQRRGASLRRLFCRPTTFLLRTRRLAHLLYSCVAIMWQENAVALSLRLSRSPGPPRRVGNPLICRPQELCVIPQQTPRGPTPGMRRIVSLNGTHEYEIPRGVDIRKLSREEMSGDKSCSRCLTDAFVGMCSDSVCTAGLAGMMEQCAAACPCNATRRRFLADGHHPVPHPSNVLGCANIDVVQKFAENGGLCGDQDAQLAEMLKNRPAQGNVYARSAVELICCTAPPKSARGPSASEQLQCEQAEGWPNEEKFCRAIAPSVENGALLQDAVPNDLAGGGQQLQKLRIQSPTDLWATFQEWVREQVHKSQTYAPLQEVVDLETAYLLGAGAFGQVYAATLKATGERVAVKRYQTPSFERPGKFRFVTWEDYLKGTKRLEIDLAREECRWAQKIEATGHEAARYFIKCYAANIGEMEQVPAVQVNLPQGVHLPPGGLPVPMKLRQKSEKLPRHATDELYIVLEYVSEKLITSTGAPEPEELQNHVGSPLCPHQFCGEVGRNNQITSAGVGGQANFSTPSIGVISFNKVDVTGQSLQRPRSSSPLPDAQRSEPPRPTRNPVLIIRQLFEAVHFLNNVVGASHHDLKSDNLLFSVEHNAVKIIDYGAMVNIRKAIELGRLGNGVATLWTPGFAPKELEEGSGEEALHALETFDIFSLANVLGQLLMDNHNVIQSTYMVNCQGPVVMNFWRCMWKQRTYFVKYEELESDFADPSHLQDVFLEPYLKQLRLHAIVNPVNTPAVLRKLDSRFYQSSAGGGAGAGNARRPLSARSRSGSRVRFADEENMQLQEEHYLEPPHGAPQLPFGLHAHLPAELGLGGGFGQLSRSKSSSPTGSSSGLSPSSILGKPSCCTKPRAARATSTRAAANNSNSNNMQEPESGAGGNNETTVAAPPPRLPHEYRGWMLYQFYRTLPTWFIENFLHLWQQMFFGHFARLHAFRRLLLLLRAHVNPRTGDFYEQQQYFMRGRLEGNYFLPGQGQPQPQRRDFVDSVEEIGQPQPFFQQRSGLVKQRSQGGGGCNLAAGAKEQSCGLSAFFL
ncbi:unnamed protein product [Amoebophrya sp. A25]|nr:unnamed protein product [Amoebophrya sp. A25]|eukprot:GSA25T00020593001.1